MERNISYDVIRAVAIFFVVCIHSMGLVNDAVRTGDSVANIVNAIGGVIYCGVPLFVMLSGALLLGKEEPSTMFFKKRLPRVLIPFLFWSVVVGAILFYQEGGRSIGGFLLYDLKGIATSGVHFIYWYVYMILGLYFLTPVLRAIVNGKDGKRVLAYFCVLTFVVSVFGEVFPSVYLISHWVSMNVDMLFYYMMGYLLATAINSQYKSYNYKRLFLVFFLILYVANTFARYKGVKIPGLAMVLSLSLFGFLMTLNMSSNKVVRLTVQMVSKYSYGIYLSHFMLISVLVKTQIPDAIPLFVEPLLMAVTVLVVETAMMFVFDKLRLGKIVM